MLSYTYFSNGVFIGEFSNSDALKSAVAEQGRKIKENQEKVLDELQGKKFIKIKF